MLASAVSAMPGWGRQHILIHQDTIKNNTKDSIFPVVFPVANGVFALIEYKQRLYVL